MHVVVQRFIALLLELERLCGCYIRLTAVGGCCVCILQREAWNRRDCVWNWKYKGYSASFCRERSSLFNLNGIPCAARA